MIKICLLEHDGKQHIFEVGPDRSLMRAAVENNVRGIIAECGGSLACGTCHVYLRPEWLDKVPPPSEMETAMLEMVIEPTERSRLSCCIELTPALDGLTVDIPASQH
jgi:ferredoxin, 2Fe-2S